MKISKNQSKQSWLGTGAAVVCLLLFQVATTQADEKPPIDNPFAPIAPTANAKPDAPKLGIPKPTVPMPTEGADAELSEDDKTPDGSASKPEVSPEQLKEWVRQLDSDKYAERESATNQLIEAGAKAIDSASQAASSDSREVASRATRVLKEIMREGEPKARTALQKLASGDNDRVARRAKNALKTAQAEDRLRPFNPRRVAGIAPRVQVQRNVRVVRRGKVNGDKTLDITDNGKKIHITDSPTKGIKIKVTEKVNGKDKVTEYAAKNKEELKKKQPEGFKLYEKHMIAAAGNPLGGLKVQINRPNPVFPQPVPAQRFAIPVPRGFAPRIILKPEKETEKPKDKNSKEQVDRLSKELKAAQAKIDQIEARLKQLDEKSSDEKDE